MSTRAVRLDEIPTVPDMAIDNGQVTQRWTRIDLADPQHAIPPEPPAILGLLYRGKRHVLSGPPESTKTLVAYALLLEAHRAGSPVAILDFEMGPTAARRMLDDLGATLDEIRAIYYTEPDRPPTQDDIDELSDHGAQYVLIDAAVGAYDASGLDDNARKEVERFARLWVKPLFARGIATIVIDHVTKDSSTRGKFTIGSERKTGGADVHLGLDALKPLSRGGTGLVKASVHKDRPAFLQRPTAAVLELQSHPLTHRITLTIRDPHPTDEESGEFRPTALMEKVSRHLEHQSQPISRNQVESDVKGKRDFLRTALDLLVRDDFLAESQGARGARLVTSLKPYRRPSDDFAPTSPHFAPGEDTTTSPHLAPPSQGGEGTGRGQSGEDTTPTSPRHTDEEINRLMRLYDTELGTTDR